MKSESRKSAGGRRGARRGKPESPQSNKTFRRRTARPGDVGLANEARPGLGTRGKKVKAPAKSNAKFDRDPLGRNAPLPPRAKRDQAPDTMAHEMERNTGASGQMGI